MSPCALATLASQAVKAWARAVSAQLDPQRLHYLDVNKLDDARTIDADPRASRRWTADFGAIVQVMPGKDGLLHISQIANERVNAVADYLKEGQQVRVKVLETDDRGRLKLSMKAAAAEEGAEPEQQHQS